MNNVQVSKLEVDDPHHGAVPCSAIIPSDAPDALPLCLFLYGGGGSHRSLDELAPLLARWFADGSLPRMLVATPDVGPWSFYLDDPERGLHWESFLVERFVPHLRRTLGLAAEARTGLVGVSMGGYAALKLALARPHAYRAVAALSPMIEPDGRGQDARARHRYHYPPEVPQALLGRERDAALCERDHPAARARVHADALRASSLALYIDAAGRDALHAHDGAESLHRVLWALDVAHEYRLHRDADHVGPDLIERLEAAFRWVGARLVPVAAAPLDALEQAWLSWLESPRGAEPPAPLAPTSQLFSRVLRAQLEPHFREAKRTDDTMERVYGVLP